MTTERPSSWLLQKSWQAVGSLYAATKRCCADCTDRWRLEPHDTVADVGSSRLFKALSRNTRLFVNFVFISSSNDGILQIRPGGILATHNHSAIPDYYKV
jgi:hypothetical protein